MQWSVASRSAFYRGRENWWIAFSFNSKSLEEKSFQDSWPQCFTLKMSVLEVLYRHYNIPVYKSLHCLRLFNAFFSKVSVFDFYFQVYAWVAVFVLPLNSAMNPVLYTISTAPFMRNIRKRASRFRKSFTGSSRNNDTKNSFIGKVCLRLQVLDPFSHHSSDYC